jgi:hypothetical protein
MLLGEIIAVYSENLKKSINTFCGSNAVLLIVKGGGINSYHCVLKGEGKNVDLSMFENTMLRRIFAPKRESNRTLDKTVQ